MIRVLIDECVPRRLCTLLVGLSCQTVVEAGYGGKKNGLLLTLAEQAGFTVFVTVDKGVQHQQNMAARRISIVVIQAESNDIDDLIKHVPSCLEILHSIQPGQIIRLPRSSRI